MRICVFGAGAVGGHFATRLAAGGHEVSVVARGAHLEAIRSRGLTLKAGDNVTTAKVAASDDPADLGVQDAVIVTLKSHGLPAFAAAAAPLLGPDTGVVFAQNGTPWWYAHGLSPQRPAPPDLAFLDPGVIVNDSPTRNVLVVSEIDDRPSPRVAALRAALNGSGVGSPEAADIRQVIWSKLTGNMTVSVLCMLTGLPARAAMMDEGLWTVTPRLMEEAYAVARAHGMDLTYSPAGRSQAPDHKPSLLQDFELGRPVELDALVRGPQAFARAAGLETPVLDTLAALAIQRGLAAGLYTPG